MTTTPNLTIDAPGAQNITIPGRKLRRSVVGLQPGMLRYLASRHLQARMARDHGSGVPLDRSQAGVRSPGLSEANHNTGSPGGPTILQRVAAGEQRAMEECIREFGGLVWTLISKRIADRTSAEDLTQEVFTEIWKSSGRFDPAKGSEATFVGLIARRRALDWLRRQERQPDLQPLPDDLDARIPQEEAAADTPYDIEQVRKAVADLPEETRMLFSLHFDQGLSHHEIARDTGMALGSVKTRLRRGLIEARSNLRRLLGRDSTTPSVGGPVTR